MAGGPSRVERCLPGHTNNRGKTGRTPMAGAVIGAIPCGQRIIGVSVAGVIYRHLSLGLNPADSMTKLRQAVTL